MQFFIIFWWLSFLVLLSIKSDISYQTLSICLAITPYQSEPFKRRPKNYTFIYLANKDLKPFIHFPFHVTFFKLKILVIDWCKNLHIYFKYDWAVYYLKLYLIWKLKIHNWWLTFAMWAIWIKIVWFRVWSSAIANFWTDTFSVAYDILASVNYESLRMTCASLGYQPFTNGCNLKTCM